MNRYICTAGRVRSYVMFEQVTHVFLYNGHIISYKSKYEVVSTWQEDLVRSHEELEDRISSCKKNYVKGEILLSYKSQDGRTHLISEESGSLNWGPINRFKNGNKRERTLPTLSLLHTLSHLTTSPSLFTHSTSL